MSAFSVRHRVVLGGAAAIALAAGVATAQSAIGGQESTPKVDFSSAPTTQNEVAKAQGAFSVLRTTPNAKNAVDDKLAATLERLTNAKASGVGVARSVQIGAERTVSIAAGSTKICWTIKLGGGGSVGCTPVASAVDPTTPMLSYTENGPGKWVVSGLVVDGTTDVQVTTAKGATDAKVHSNVFSIEVSAKPALVRWVTPGGQALRFTWSGDS